jgi:uncharacterized protein YpmB
MKKEVLIIIFGVIFLAVLYYFLSKKPTVTPVNTGIIPQATTAINKLGTSISVTSTDIKAVADALTSLLGLKKAASNTGIAGGTDTTIYDNTVLETYNPILYG